MRIETLRLRLAATSLALLLGGCSGDGGDGGDAPTVTDGGDGASTAGDAAGPGTPSEGSGGGTPGDVGQDGGGAATGAGDGGEASGSRFSYRLEPTAGSAAAFVAAGNALGAEGYRFQAPTTFDTEPPFEILDLYVRDERAPGRYTVRTRPDLDDPDALLAEMNAEGADGYSFRGPLAFGLAPGGTPETVSVYLRDESAPATLAYEALPVVTRASGLLEQANAQGERGFRYLSVLAFGDGTEQRAFYEMNASAPGRFDYRTEEAPPDADGLIVQANRQGAEGYAYRGPVFTDSADTFGAGGTLLALYRRDATRSGTLAYALDVDAGSADAFLAQTVAQGEEGRLFAGPIGERTNDFTLIRALYVDVSDCDCEPLRLGTPFID